VEAEALRDAVRSHIDAGEIPGAVVGVLRDGRASVEAAGTIAPGDRRPMSVDTLVRISSNTKAMTAALALSLAEEGAFALEDPVERFLPELADRRVLRRLDGPLDDTVPAERPVTVEDLLTMRLGFGFVFEADCPAVGAAARAGLGIGPPDPSVRLSPETWIARFAELPLLEQPGSTWRYELAYAVLGVVLARAGGRPLEELFRTRLFEPLGMTDTGFVAPQGRLPPCFAASHEGLVLFDAADDSRWNASPAFPDARNGLVSTAADLLCFAGALLGGGKGVLSPAAVSAMTTDQLTPEQRRGPSAQVFLDGCGWGYGVQVVPPADDGSVARYGWGGGLGTLSYSWPDHHGAAVLLTQVLPPSASLIEAFNTGAERALTS
jgi:CubicO group peptidase (beta-lactamase class C family)